MAAGKVVGVDPQAWKIIDGKLYLSWNKAAADRFQQNASAKIAKADKMWTQLREQD